MIRAPARCSGSMKMMFMVALAAMLAVPVANANAQATSKEANFKAVPTVPLGIAAETQTWATNNVSPLAIEITAMTNTVQTSFDFTVAAAATTKIETTKTVAMEARAPTQRWIGMAEFAEVTEARGSPVNKMKVNTGVMVYNLQNAAMILGNVTTAIDAKKQLVRSNSTTLMRVPGVIYTPARKDAKTAATMTVNIANSFRLASSSTA